MKTNILKIFFMILFTSFNFFVSHSQNSSKNTVNFWDNVQFGGGLGLNIGSGFTDINIAPGAIYNFNEFFSAGIGLQYSYINVKDSHTNNLIGASLIGLTNPFPELQLSLELEQIHADIKYDRYDLRDNFWNTNLFVGIGFRTNNIAAGIKYNVLHDAKKSIYPEAYMPFVRIYF